MSQYCWFASTNPNLCKSKNGLSIIFFSRGINDSDVSLQGYTVFSLLAYTALIESRFVKKYSSTNLPSFFF